MFKCGSIEKELMQSMENELVSQSVEKKYNFSKLAKAIDYLDTAANIFDRSGFSDEADEIIKIIQSLTKGEK